jgi:prepilin-type processing-associated H-X9-DG protein
MTWISADDFWIAYVWSFNSKNIAQPINSAPFVETWDDQPGPFAIHDVSLGSNHPGGCHVLMADGSTHFLREEIDLEGVYKPMASRESGDFYTSPF